MVEDVNFIASSLAFGIFVLIIATCFGIIIIGISGRLASYHINTMT